MSSTSRSIHRATIAMVALVIWSCGGAAPTSDAPGGVAAVLVSPPSSTLSLNATLPLQAEVHDAGGTALSNLPIVWTVRDPAIATVSETGVVTAKSLGTTQVAASSGGKSGVATITVQKTPVATVTVRPDRVEAVVGGRTQLTGTTTDAAGNALPDRAIVWSSSNPGVATVDATGLVVAVSAGTVTITGASEGKSATSQFNIVQGAIASVSVTPNPVTMLTGQEAQLAASARDANNAVVSGRSVVWSSSNTTVATVNSDGVVKALTGGSTTITATVDGVGGTSVVTVSNVPVASVSVSPDKPTLAVGASTQLNATLKDASNNTLSNRPIAWTSSNTAIASVSNTGVVTAVAAGTATITATSEGKSGSSSVTVTVVPVGSVAVAPTTVTLIPGAKSTLTATVTDANGAVVTDRPVAWSSSNDLIATVTQSGVVTAVAVGSATITVSIGSKSATSAITVTLAPVGGVAVSPASVSLNPTQTTTLTATVTDVNGTVVTGRPVAWSSSNDLVATVSQSGVVTALLPGNATITASSGGKSGTAAVTVGQAAVGSVTVTPSSSTLQAGAGTTLVAAVKDANGNPVSNPSVTWTSTNPQVASVNSSGAVSTSQVGTATITATSGGKSGTATITVTAGPVATVNVSPKLATVRVNRTTTLTASAVDAKGNAITGRTFSWSSSATATATVTADNPSTTATVTGRKVGTATITVTLDGKSTTATVTVTN